MTVDVQALADLARVEIPEAEAAAIGNEIESIIGFVDTIQAVAAELPDAQAGEHRNVFREDANPHESGKYTHDLINAAPDHTDTHVRVSQVISTGRYAKE